MATFHIHIEGQVQGVGFRPFVYKLASIHSFKGWVNNTFDGVHIEINGTKKQADEFLKEIIENVPIIAIITKYKIRKTENKKFDSFNIIHSENSGKPNVLLTPDYSICNDCREELYDIKNRRYRYPFITCTNCGPRYSIINSLPYDRIRTEMSNFTMCTSCKYEYDNPLDRRYYSQTNSCDNCKIQLTILGQENITDQEKIIQTAINFIKKGKIIAVKGIGGFLLMADASNSETIKLLRKRKNRPSKPFALMYKDVEQLKKDVYITKKEKELFSSIYSPIILFKLKNKNSLNIKHEEIAPGLNHIGAMKPYTPLFDLILNELINPVIATSANVSNSPIIFNNESAKNELNVIADLIISNNREIVLPQDDSVVKFSSINEQKIILRRSRGYAPVFINKLQEFNSTKTIFTSGAGLKSSFAYHHQNNTYVSQYLGNLFSFDTQEVYEKVTNHFFDVFQSTPQKIICDKHPQYFSTIKSKELAKKYNIPLLQVQHHKAHFASVLAENGLIESTKKILGIIWDGVGIGDDNQIWGGEFFEYSNNNQSTLLENKMIRVAHIEYFKHLSFDKFSMEPRLPALSLSYQKNEEINDLIVNKFSSIELEIYINKLNSKNSLDSSSMGRVFDAVSSIILNKNYNSFEGEAAMHLEALAETYSGNKNLDNYYHISPFNEEIPIKKIIFAIIEDLNNGIENNEIAFKFHLSLVRIIEAIALKTNTNNLAFSGGVFQNALLIDLIIEVLGKNNTLYFHQQLSPNDECISYGQLQFEN